jgi:hypothetical protein
VHVFSNAALVAVARKLALRYLRLFVRLETLRLPVVDFLSLLFKLVFQSLVLLGEFAQVESKGEI